MRELQQQWYSIISDDLFLWNRIYNPKGYQSKCFWSRISLKERNNITPFFVLKMRRNIITSKFSMKELPIYHSWKVLYASTELFKWNSSWSNISYGYMIIYFCSIDRYVGHRWKNEKIKNLQILLEVFKHKSSFLMLKYPQILEGLRGQEWVMIICSYGYYIDV